MGHPVFYDSTFKAMTFSMCPEAEQNISNRVQTNGQGHTNGKNIDF